MPRLSQWFIRAALLYLVAGFSLGAVMLANKGIIFYPDAWALLPAHIEFLLIGFFAQLAMGVAFWIMPRFTGGSRGNPIPAWFVLALLNAGILLAAVPSLGISSGFWVISGRLFECLAAGLFGWSLWPRVRPNV